MKYFLTLMFIVLSSLCFSQYSTYYNVYKKVDVDQNVTVSGNINTIDYGALAAANAMREKTRLDNLKLNDQRAIAIAGNPMLAFDYGEDASFSYDKSMLKSANFKKLSVNFKTPSNALFSVVKDHLENISMDGVKTELYYGGVLYNKDQIEVNIEDSAKYKNYIVGEINKNVTKDNKDAFLHKKVVDRATVWSENGFKGSLIWEDEYEYRIVDTYWAYTSEGILLKSRVIYKGSKNEINFEKLEGRRYYLKGLLEKIISTAYISNYKIDN